MSLRPGLRAAVIGLTALAVHAAPPGTPTTQPSSSPASAPAPATSQSGLLTMAAADALLEAHGKARAFCTTRAFEESEAWGGCGYALTTLALVPPGQRLLVGAPMDDTYEVDLRERLVRRRLTQSEPMVRTPDGAYFGSSGRVTAIAVTADGRYAFCGTTHGSLWRHALADDSPSKPQGFFGHAGRITGVVVRPDGREVITSSYDGTVRAWDTTTGTEVRRYAGHGGPVLALALSADGRILLTGGRDRTTRLWDVDQGRELRRLDGASGEVMDAAFSPDGTLAITAGMDTDGVVLWDVATGRPQRRLADFAGWVTAVGFSPDGRLVATAGEDQHVRLWEAASGQLVGDAEVAGRVRKLVFSADGSTIYCTTDAELVVVPVARTLAETPARLARAAQAASAPLPELDLAAVRWQVLPEDVVGVTVGPGDRVWWQLRGPAWRAQAVAAVRASIAAQFRAPSPRVQDACPVLFEPDGRVWFLTVDRKLLLGYDGQTWIERPARGAFHGLSPNHGADRPTTPNVQRGRWRFFADTAGVQVFDGEGWTALDLPMRRHEPGWESGVTLVPHPDGERLTAYRRGHVQSLWHWRQGQWTKVDGGPVMPPSPWGSPRQPEPEYLQLQAVAPLDGNGLLILGNDRLDVVSVLGAGAVSVATPTASQSAAFEAALRDLDAPDAATRNAAEAVLVARRLEFWPLIAQAAQQASSDETRLRLERILERRPTAPAVRMPGKLRLGPYDFGRPVYLHAHPSGAVLVGAGSVCPTDADPWDRPWEAGVLVRSPAGRWTFVRGEQEKWLWPTPRAVLAAGPERLWCRGFFAGKPLVLVDMARGEIVARFPYGPFEVPLAARADGTLFVGMPSRDGRPGRVGVFQPGQPEARSVVTAISGPRPRFGVFRVAIDGAVWVGDEYWALQRFDGREWSEAHCLPAGGAVVPVQCGRNGEVLVAAVEYPVAQFWLIAGEQILHGDSVQDLVTRYPDAVRAAFAGVPLPDAVSPLGLLVVASEGPIWADYTLADDRKVTWSALVGGQWQVVDAALRRAGIQTDRLRCAVALGDGRAMATTCYNQRVGRHVALVLDVDDGRVTVRSVTEGPRHWVWEFRPGERGTAWLQGADIDRNVVLARLGLNDVQIAAPNMELVLVDAGGVAWLRRPESPSGFARLWRDGREIDFLATGRDRPNVHAWVHAISDRPGSVWAITPDGLEHIVADDPARPETYRRAAVYTVDNFTYRERAYPTRRCAYSPLGYFCVYNDTEDGSELRLIPLPTAGRQPGPTATSGPATP